MKASISGKTADLIFAGRHDAKQQRSLVVRNLYSYLPGKLSLDIKKGNWLIMTRHEQQFESDTQ